MSTVTEEAPARPGYRPFRVRVGRITRLSPHFVRVTFTGDDLNEFGTAGLDQRIKVVLPTATSSVDDFVAAMSDADSVTGFSSEWYLIWRGLTAEARNPLRTYTVRAVRPADAEVDIDFVAHGDAGPASAWVGRAAIGDEAVLIGPDALADDSRGGIEWRPGSARTVLLAGDETAVPAISSILEALPTDARGCALLEVPSLADMLPIDAPAGVTVHWFARDDREYGDALTDAVKDWTSRFLTSHHSGAPFDDIDVETELLWEVPEGTSLDGELYAWVAGEAHAVKTIRRFLVKDVGLDRRTVAFMGYWRKGASEEN